MIVATKQKRMETKEFLTMKEVQLLLNYKSRNAVYRFVTINNIGKTSPSGKLYFNRTDIMNTLHKCEVKMGV